MRRSVNWPKLVELFKGRLQLDLRECSGDTLAFRIVSGQPRCGPQQATVTCGETTLTSKLVITVVKDKVVYARWDSPGPEELALSDQVRVERRTEERRDFCLRVDSEDLPGNGCFTQNIGADGLQILICDAVPTGHQVELSLTTDESGAMPIKLSGEVRWCRRTENGHLAGVSVCESQQRRLKAVHMMAERAVR